MCRCNDCFEKYLHWEYLYRIKQKDPNDEVEVVISNWNFKDCEKAYDFIPLDSNLQNSSNKEILFYQYIKALQNLKRKKMEPYKRLKSITKIYFGKNLMFKDQFEIFLIDEDGGFIITAPRWSKRRST